MYYDAASNFNQPAQVCQRLQQLMQLNAAPERSGPVAGRPITIIDAISSNAGVNSSKMLSNAWPHERR